MRTYSRVVMTSGVSAFLPRNQLRTWAEEQGMLVWQGQNLNPSPAPGLSAEQAYDRLQRAKPGLRTVAEPEKVSAEYSALHTLRAEGRLSPSPRVVLIHTDSVGGTAAAILVGMLLERDFDADVHLRSVSLDLGDRVALRYGLGGFMQSVAAALGEGEPSTTAFVPLGGYKIMTSLGYLAGAYRGYPTLYIQEETQIVHEVPAVPIRIAHGDLERIAGLMRSVRAGFPIDDLDQAALELVDEFPWLFERSDDLIGVNAFGVFLMDDPDHRELFSTPIAISDQVGDVLSSSHGEFAAQQIEVLARKLASRSNEQGLQHEMQWNLRSDRGQHLYKGASNGRLAFRCLYRFANDRLEVEHAWTSHERYEEEAAAQWSEASPTPRNFYHR